jgi:uncharacterized protein YdeI (YjbR/CyaY-like superfamily)
MKTLVGKGGMSEKLPEVSVHGRTEWRRWLSRHHNTSKGVWLVFAKARGLSGGVDYDAAVEEAICFGWIDSLVRKIDARSYARKFTPRSDVATWSKANRKRLRKMTSEGKMTASGMTVASPGRLTRRPLPPRRANIRTPPFMQAALARDENAGKFFAILAPSQRWAYIAWIASAKLAETRQRRLREAMLLLRNEKKLGLK